jgi:hypothetical protein
MSKKAKRPTPRKAPVKRKAAKPAPRKKAARRKKAKKPESRLEKIENAILVGAAQADDVAISLGLIAASQPPPKSGKKGR